LFRFHRFHAFNLNATGHIYEMASNAEPTPTHRNDGKSYAAAAYISSASSREKPPSTS
jgi:hypothetical protein